MSEEERRPDDWTLEDLEEMHRHADAGVIPRPPEGFIPAPDQDELRELLDELKSDLFENKMLCQSPLAHLNVRLENGWGNWVPSMERAVELAVQLCFESRDQLTEDHAYQEMVDYVKGREG